MKGIQHETCTTSYQHNAHESEFHTTVIGTLVRTPHWSFLLRTISASV